MEEWFFKAHDEHLCMFTEMGWLDDSYNFDTVTANLTWEAIDTCIMESITVMTEDPVIQQCVDNYEADDRARIEELATATASMKCFLDMFNDSCKMYVKDQIMAYGATLAAAQG